MNEILMITIVFSVRPGRVDELDAILAEAFQQTRQRAGCRSIHAGRHAELDRIILVEEWDSRLAYDDYMAWRVSRGEDPDTLNHLLAGPIEMNFWTRAA